MNAISDKAAMQQSALSGGTLAHTAQNRNANALRRYTLWWRLEDVTQVRIQIQMWMHMS